MLAIVMAGCSTALADSLTGQGIATGNAVLWFSGTNATGTFDGTFALTGHLVIADEVIAFTASGWARGSGSGNTSTMDIDAWATFAASGLTVNGEEIVVQGGLTLSGLSAGASDSSSSGTGDFVATIFYGGQIYTAQGSAAGFASGSFVIPADPLSMELAGEGVFELSGELALDPLEGELPVDPTIAASAVEALPWAPEGWPEDLLAELLDILSRIVDSSTSSE
jgi:hypothetical protein